MKIITLIIALFVSITVNAQAEKEARRLTDEMTEVLNLSDADAKKVYKIALVKQEKVSAFKKANPDLKGAELKRSIRPTIIDPYVDDLRAIIGQDNWNTLLQFYNEKMAKAKKKK
jgi:hypothetical protein